MKPFTLNINRAKLCSPSSTKHHQQFFYRSSFTTISFILRPIWERMLYNWHIRCGSVFEWAFLRLFVNYSIAFLGCRLIGVRHLDFYWPLHFSTRYVRILHWLVLVFYLWQSDHFCTQLLQEDASKEVCSQLLKAQKPIRKFRSNSSNSLNFIHA